MNWLWQNKYVQGALVAVVLIAILALLGVKATCNAGDGEIMGGIKWRAGEK